jgi:hypothetical protein
MKTYPVDLEAQQIVRWLIEEQRRGALSFDTVASRCYVTEDLENSETQRFSEDAEDLSDVLAVGVLEIRPSAAHDGWVLRIRVEDRLGPRLPEDEDVPGEEEEIDLAAFETEFIQPGRGIPEVLLDAEDAHAKARFSRVFKQMLTGEHRFAAKR